MTTPVRVRQSIRQLETKGLTHARIARELGVSRTTVVKHATRDYSPVPPTGELWIGNGVLDGSLENESLFGEFLRAPVSEGGVEPLVVGPPHAAVGVMPRLPDRGVAVPVHELLPQQPIRRLDHGVAVGATPARQRSFDVEHVERLVDPRVVELAAPVGVEHLDVRQREVEGGERGQHQACVPGPPGGMAGDSPVRQAGQQAHVRPVSADADIGKIARRTRVRDVAVGPAGPTGSRARPRRPASCAVRIVRARTRSSCPVRT